MESKGVEELIQEAVRRMDAGTSREILFNREGRIIHANEKARAFFNRPLLTRHDLPEELTAGLDDALAKGRQSAFCFQVTGGPLLRNRLYPEHFDLTQPEASTCALLCMEEKMGGCVPESIAVELWVDLYCAKPGLATNLQLYEVLKSDPEYLAILKQAGDCMIMAVSHIQDILLSVVNQQVGLAARETVSLASIIAEAYQELQFYRSAPLQRVCNGPDDLAFSTSSRQQRRLITLFREILLGAHHPSNPVPVQWAEDHERLGVPTAKVEFSFDFHSHSRWVYYASSENRLGFDGTTAHFHSVYDASLGNGLGLDVATEIVLDMHGCVELTPGNPATLCLWLPLTLPERG